MYAAAHVNASGACVKPHLAKVVLALVDVLLAVFAPEAIRAVAGVVSGVIYTFPPILAGTTLLQAEWDARLAKLPRVSLGARAAVLFHSVHARCIVLAPVPNAVVDVLLTSDAPEPRLAHASIKGKKKALLR